MDELDESVQHESHTTTVAGPNTKKRKEGNTAIEKVLKRKKNGAANAVQKKGNSSTSMETQDHETENDEDLVTDVSTEGTNAARDYLRTSLKERQNGRKDASTDAINQLEQSTTLKDGATNGTGGTCKRASGEQSVREQITVKDRARQIYNEKQTLMKEKNELDAQLQEIKTREEQLTAEFEQQKTMLNQLTQSNTLYIAQIDEFANTKLALMRVAQSAKDLSRQLNYADLDHVTQERLSKMNDALTDLRQFPCTWDLGRMMHDSIEQAIDGHSDYFDDMVRKLQLGEYKFTYKDMVARNDKRESILTSAMRIPDMSRLRQLMDAIVQACKHTLDGRTEEGVSEMLWLCDDGVVNGPCFMDTISYSEHNQGLTDYVWKTFHDFLSRRTPTNCYIQNVLTLAVVARHHGHPCLMNSILRGPDTNNDNNPNLFADQVFWDFYDNGALFEDQDSTGCSAMDSICMFGFPDDLKRFDEDKLRSVILTHHAKLIQNKFEGPLSQYKKSFFPDNMDVKVSGVSWSCMHLAALSGNKAMLDELIKRSGLSAIDAYDLKASNGYSVSVCLLAAKGDIDLPPPKSDVGSASTDAV